MSGFSQSQSGIQRSNRNRSVTAVLGPTNTGKTHLAIERMLGHESGMIGLPLRLLAREVYAKVVKRVGADAVALVTGEEKILPPEPRYWVCTVEAMPQDTDAAFVAIDEVQLAADLERGHVFTDRILNLRGSQETLLLGAATMRGILERIVPGLNVITRPRMSVLSYGGQKKISRLPARSAIVAFSAEEVYTIAELVRRQRGGTAVVMGALSPRTRNAQVELYQSGDVDFLIATDAIGMGLNLDVDHVAFASSRKFDGYQYRDLTPAELGQISGRAGRHMKDGTFGVTGRVDPFADSLVEALETHAFEPVKILQWRARDLDMRSLNALRASLDSVPNVEGLTRAPPATDLNALDQAMRDGEMVDAAHGADQVALLWDVCQLPDYRNIAPANHYELIHSIYMQISRDGFVDPDWFESSVRQVSSTEGDIDTLANRISHIRTWTFVANRPAWLKQPDYWQEKTREIEDGLSDALHDRLTQRFVDRRTSVLMKRLRENTMLEAEFTESGHVVVEGEHVGHLDGFRFTPASKGDSAEAKAVRAAAMKALAVEISRRAERVGNADNSAFVLAGGDTIRWQGEAVAKLSGTDDMLKPRVIPLADEHLTGSALEKVQTRLDAWIQNHIATYLKPLLDIRDSAELTGIARGVAFRLVERLGNIERTAISEDIRKLDQDVRAVMRRLGVRFGAHTIFLPLLLKPAPSQLLAELWALTQTEKDIPGLQEIPQLSASGRTSVPVDATFSTELYRIAGYRVCGARAVRVDILERLADLIRPLIAWRPSAGAQTPPGAIERGGGFTVTVAMTSLLGCSGDDFAGVLRSLGYRVERVVKPKAPEPAAEAAPAGEAAVDAAATPQAEPATNGEAAADAVESAVVPSQAVTDSAAPDAAQALGAETAAPVVEITEPAGSVAPVAAQAVATMASDSAAPAGEAAADGSNAAPDAVPAVGAESAAPEVEIPEPAGSVAPVAAQAVANAAPDTDCAAPAGEAAADGSNAAPDAVPAVDAESAAPEAEITAPADSVAQAVAEPVSDEAAATDGVAPDAAHADSQAKTRAGEPADGVAPDSAKAEPEKPDEPEMIEIWRPGGGERRRQNQARPSHNRQAARGKPAAGKPEQERAGENGAAKPESGRPGRDGAGGGRKDAKGGPGRRHRQGRGERPGDDAERKNGGRGPNPNAKGQGRGPRQDAAGAKPARPARPEKPIDPDSPFAALAALKASLEKNGK